MVLHRARPPTMAWWGNWRWGGGWGWREWRGGADSPAGAAGEAAAPAATAAAPAAPAAPASGGAPPRGRHARTTARALLKNYVHRCNHSVQQAVEEARRHCDPFDVHAWAHLFATPQAYAAARAGGSFSTPALAPAQLLQAH